MPSQNEILLCRYEYDPLDRLVACTSFERSSTQRFYLKDRLATEIESAMHRSIFQHEDQVLAQYMLHNGEAGTTLLATDLQRSVLNALDARRQPNPIVYTPYGHRPLEGGLFSLLGFNGERPDPVTRHYSLGNGYRAFNPVLMRFNNPDSLSPFGKGGLNTYAYCGGDPVNYEDRSGQMRIPSFLKRPLRALGIIRKSKAPTDIDPVTKTDNNVSKGGHLDSGSSSQVQKPLAKGPISNESGARGTHAPSPSLSMPQRAQVQQKKGFIRKVTDGSQIQMIPISGEALSDIRVVARNNPGLDISNQSSLIRGLAKLPSLPKGEYYIFPNVPEGKYRS